MSIRLELCKKKIEEVRAQKRSAFKSTIPEIQRIGALNRRREVLDAKRKNGRHESQMAELDRQIAEFDRQINEARRALTARTNSLLNPLSQIENELLVRREEFREEIRARHNGVVPIEDRMSKPDYLPGQLDDIRARRNAEREAMAPKPIVPYSAPASGPADQERVEDGDWRDLTPDELNNHRVAGASGSPTAAPRPLLVDQQMAPDLVQRPSEVQDFSVGVEETLTLNRGLLQLWGQDKQAWNNLRSDGSLTDYLEAVNDWRDYEGQETAQRVKECSARLRESAVKNGLRVDLYENPKRRVPI